MSTRMKVLLLLGIVVLTILFVGSNARTVVATDPSPSDYRVPFIGSYKITQMDCGNHVGKGRFMDINGWSGGNSDEGDPVYASGTGNVTVNYDGNYGNNVVQVANGGVTFRYAHLDKVYAISGTQVIRGGLIGLMGRTGMQNYASNDRIAHLGPYFAEPFYMSLLTPVSKGSSLPIG